MNLDKLREFINLAKEEKVTELKYETEEAKFYVSFEQTSVQAPVVTKVVNPVVDHAMASIGSTESNSKINSSQFKEIKSPFVGTYYSSPSPDSPSFVSVGQKVKKGQVLCILEAMKIMNEIESDVDGEIVEICLENESLTEYGEVLFRIKP